jgi:cytoskeletal protein CcmA (bactofilin family)
MAGYTRQSTYTDGDIIDAADSNDEFDQLLAAFNASSGHTHDGTAAEGAAITKLLSNTLTFGAATSGTDITITFDGETNDGVLKWMEDEDYFEFSDDILVASTEKIQFRDTAIYINSSADGQLDLVADTEIQIAATTIDMNGAADISGNLAVGGNLTVAGNATVTGTTTFNGGTLTLGDSASDNVVFGADVDSHIIPDDDDTYDLGSSSQQWRNLFIDGTANIDTASIDNISDDTLVATDKKIQFRDTGLYINSSTDGQLDIVADTEVQIAATTVDINGAVDVSGNLSVGGNLDVTGTFDLSDSNFTNAGDIQLDSITGDSDTNTSITFSGSDVITVTTGGETQVTFNNGSILPTTDNDVDLGSSSLEFKDLYIDGTAYVDAINFNGTAISATAAELNIMDGVTSTAAELNILDGVTSTAAELNILDGVTSTAAELNILDGVTATTAEINLIDGDTSRGTTAVASGDGILINDAGTMRMTNVDTVSTYFASHNVGGGNIVTTGALNSGSITSGFGAIDNGSSNITTTGVGSFGSLDISGAIDVDGTSNLDAVDIDGAVDMASTLQVTGVATLTATAIANAGVSVKNGATSAGFVEFFEDSDNGSNKVTLIGPASTADVTLTLPAAAGTVATTDDATALAIALG